jgi:hypothetical protein
MRLSWLMIGSGSIALNAIPPRIATVDTRRVKPTLERGCLIAAPDR